MPDDLGVGRDAALLDEVRILPAQLQVRIAYSAELLAVHDEDDVREEV